MADQETEASRSINIISKVLAILLIFIGFPCYVGILFDRNLGTSWITPVAVIGGTFAGLGALLLVVKKMELDEPKGEARTYRTPEEIDEEEAKWREPSSPSPQTREKED